MDFKIVKLYQGDGEEERLVLQATADADIGEYMILDATYGKGGEITNYFRHPFWFPDKLIKKGEFVVLYTRNGTTPKKNNTHFFYLGSEHNVWNDDNDSVTLLHITEWSNKKFSDIHVKK